MNKKTISSIGIGLAGLLAGGVIATVGSANAADTTTPTAPSTTSVAPVNPDANGSAATKGAHPDFNDRSATPVRPDETALNDSDAAKVKAVAESAVTGGTVFRVETDGDGAKYEAHVAKADGSVVTVKVDENFKLVEVQDGMGAGGPKGAFGGRGHGHGPRDGQAQGSTGAPTLPGATTNSTTPSVN